MRNIGTGPARIPTDDKSVIAQFWLFGGLTAIGRLSQRVVAKDDIVYLVFCGSFGEPSTATFALPPEEAKSAAIVCVQHTGIDRSRLSQTRLVYRYFRGWAWRTQWSRSLTFRNGTVGGGPSSSRCHGLVYRRLVVSPA
jgi:hypothetical protein